MEAFSDDDEDDPVVQELDIYCCNGLLPDVAKVKGYAFPRTTRPKDVFGQPLTILTFLRCMQLYLLQSPLRPKWRPYDLEEATKVCMQVERQSLATVH